MKALETKREKSSPALAEEKHTLERNPTCPMLASKSRYKTRPRGIGEVKKATQGPRSSLENKLHYPRKRSFVGDPIRLVSDIRVKASAKQARSSPP